MALISRSLMPVRPQQLGRIKIGGLGKLIKGKDGKPDWRAPTKYEHFVITNLTRGADGNFMRDDRIHAALGTDTPTELEGVLMYDTPEENFHSEMCQYKGRGAAGKIWTCDGETATNLKTGKVGACIKAGGGECACKPYARFHIQLAAAPFTMGYHFFRTTSWESTNNIQTALEEIHARFGTCYHAPVKMICYPSEDQHDGKTSTSYKVGLVLAMKEAEAATLIGEAQQYMEVARGRMKQLAAVTHQDLAEQDMMDESDIADEFFAGDDAEVHAEVVSAMLDADDDQDEATDEVVEQDELEL